MAQRITSIPAQEAIALMQLGAQLQEESRYAVKTHIVYDQVVHCPHPSNFTAPQLHPVFGPANKVHLDPTQINGYTFDVGRCPVCRECYVKV